ncbi:hypothetical protein [Sporosarcina thermotolerans]|uniref:hypothetical protein n=1 Tax=Sporosarcina thermotolerans TaxID=633404 RepID=UPI0036D31DE9
MNFYTNWLNYHECFLHRYLYNLKKEVDYKLELSDKVVNGDLLRFYTPKGYTPVDPSQYNYTKDE